MTKPWKSNQELYMKLVTKHEDDKSNFVVRHDDEIVNNALNYFKERADEAVYPAKSYAVGIIYATFISETFDEDFYEVLDDPDLFMDQDEDFVIYSEDKENYDAIISGLEQIYDWRNGGWAEKSFQYCYLECTDEGITEVLENQYKSQDLL